MDGTINQARRFAALDAFRGLTIAAMILVNTPGSWSYVYAPLRHAKWHGCTPTDFIFPFFLFIIGVAMWFSFEKYGRSLSGAAVRKIAKRAAIIFLIGFVLNIYPFNRDMSGIRIMGVLQRIGLAYCLAALLCLSLDRLKLLIASAVVLIGYWILLAVLGDGDPFGLEGNLVRKIDIAVLGESHLWKGTGVPFDPEGILSTLPAVVSIISGYLVGAWVQASGTEKPAIANLPLFGAGLILLGRLWNVVFPINKYLWTSSYVLYTTGTAVILLSLFILLIDICNHRRWAFPFIVFGMNSLFIYTLSAFWVLTSIYVFKFDANGGTVTLYSRLYNSIFVPAAGLMNGSLLFALSHILVYWLLLFLLYRKRIFIKI
jgi:predicted acyltransferase